MCSQYFQLDQTEKVTSDLKLRLSSKVPNKPKHIVSNLLSDNEGRVEMGWGSIKWVDISQVGIV